MTYKKQPGRKTSAKSNQPKKSFHKPASASKSPERFERSGRPASASASDRPVRSDKAERAERYAQPDQPMRGPMGRPAGRPTRPPFKKSGKSLEGELLKKIFYELKNTSKLSGATIKQVLDYFEPPARGKKPARKPKFVPAVSRTSLTPAEDAEKKPARPSYRGTGFKKAAAKPAAGKTAAKPGLKRKTTTSKAPRR